MAPNVAIIATIIFLLPLFANAAFILPNPSPSSPINHVIDPNTLEQLSPFQITIRRPFVTSPLRSSTSTTMIKTKKEELKTLLSSTPRNAPTPSRMTKEILSSVKDLESLCPTNDRDVLAKSGGTWDLIWTTQDRTSGEGRQSLLKNWINPLENQSYSNNPSGRSNPILPRPLQDRLESLKILKPSDTPIKSTQIIDLSKSTITNIVTFQTTLGTTIRGSLFVSIDFRPDDIDERKINVKFQSCRVKLRSLDFVIPLGLIGPTGWLKTTYVDDEFRIMRGFKGSVFVLEKAGGKP